MTETFAQRLQQRMLEKGLSQSALARKIWGSITDARGHSVARNRERISAWLAGEALPDRENLQKLAAALDCTAEDLVPGGLPVIRNRREPPPGFQFSLYPDGEALIQINMKLPGRAALDIMEILQEHQAQGQAEEA